MSMKKSIGAYAMIAAAFAMGGGMGYGPPTTSRPYREPKVKPWNHKPFPIVTDIPKGHKQEILVFSFISRGYRYETEIPFTYGTSKSRLKRREKLYNELKSYITNTPHDLLVKFNQFTNEQIQNT